MVHDDRGDGQKYLGLVPSRLKTSEIYTGALFNGRPDFWVREGEKVDFVDGRAVAHSHSGDKRLKNGIKYQSNPKTK